MRRDEREKIVKMGREWKRLRRAGRGFSLLELMVSVGIMSVTLLLVLAVFTGSMRASRKTTDLTAGVVVAETVLNEVVASSSSDDAGNSKKDKYSEVKAAILSGTSSSPTVVASGVKNLNNTTFIWQLSSTCVSQGGTTTGTHGGGDNSLYKLDIVVWWGKTGETEAASTSDTGVSTTGVTDDKTLVVAGQGVLRYEMSRLYNANSNF